MLKDASRIVLCLGLFVLATSASAQAFGSGVAAALPVPPPQIELRVTASPSGAVSVGADITYDIVITNTGAPLNDVTIDNIFSDALDFVTSSRPPDGTNSNRITFNAQLGFGDVERLAVTLRATAAGNVSNLVAVSSASILLGSTNVVTDVSSPQARSDLALSVSANPTNVLVNDIFTVSVTILNLGPDPVSVSFTNTLGSNVVIHSVSPSNSVMRNGQTAVFNTGVLASNASATAVLTLSQTTPGTFAFSGSLSSANDPNPTNNTSSVSVNVGQPAAATGLSVTIGEQIFNPQNSLMEQLVQLVNTGSTVVASARLILTNFPHRVVNAVGTNMGNPFVVHGRAIQTGEVVNLVLEYFIPTRQPTLRDPEFGVVDAGMVNLNAPAVTTNVLVQIKDVHDLVRDVPTCMIEFKATPGTRYLIIYSDSVLGTTNWFQAQPSIVARANRVQWIDHGPPKTLRHPNDRGTNATVSKMYQAIPLP